MTLMQDQVCIVTGGGGGIGRAVCAMLLERGARVVLVDMETVALPAATELGRAGASIEGLACNVADRAAVDALADDVLARHGRIDALFCLAGAVRNGRLDDIDDADFALTMASHANGTLNFIRAAAPAMKAAGYGRIVVTSSVAARGTVGGMNYAAAKGAVEGIMRVAALELARYGVTVNCVAPGVVDGGMFRQQPEKAREHMISRTPMRRVAEASEIAECYGFLGSRAASFVTGQTLYACGGASVGAFL